MIFKVNIKKGIKEMKAIGIFYFSGTGNTEIVANMLKESFSNQGCQADLIRMEDVLKDKMKTDIQKYDLIGIGSQVIGFGTPNLVKKFIHTFPGGLGKKVFIFRTAGGVTPINYNASQPIIKVLTKKGYKVFYEQLFSISSNWTVKYDDYVIKELYEATKKKVKVMCVEVVRGDKRLLKTDLKHRVLMGFVREISSKLLWLVGKDYTVSAWCTGCGLCIKNCPAENIYKKNNKIKFKAVCNVCMRCIYACPKKAIKFRLFSFFPVSEDYNIKNIIEHPCIGSQDKRGHVPAFFKDYVEQE